MAALWAHTPLIRSKYCSDRLGCEVYLKLENLQPSQSFKHRGLSLFAQESLAAHGPSTHLVVASGGNAAYATCSVAETLSLKCTAYVPEGARSIEPLLLATGAEVNVGGKVYFEALGQAQAAVSRDPNAVLVPAYDHPTVWKGHSSLIEEISGQLPSDVKKPDLIVFAVGGGGLMGGIILGCKDIGWDDVPLLAMETQGSNCFYQSYLANRHTQEQSPPNILAIRNKAIMDVDETHGVTIAHMTELTSLASCLGATSPSAGVVKMALEREGPVQCVCVSDKTSMKVAAEFLDEHKMMVELACSTALAPAYDSRILQAAFPDDRRTKKVIVFVVCGGVGVSLAELAGYQELSGSAIPFSDGFWLDGVIVR